MSSQYNTDPNKSEQSPTGQNPSDEGAKKTTPAPKTEEEIPRPAAEILGVVVVLGIIAWAAWYFLEGRWYESTDDAYVNGNVVQITPQMPGTVVSIGAEDGDLVHAGQVLVKLDPSDADVPLAEAKANLANTVRKVRGLYASVNGAPGRWWPSADCREQGPRRLPATQGLAKSGAISGRGTGARPRRAERRRKRADHVAAAATTSKVLVDDTVVASQPDVQAAAAKLRAAYLDDARTTLVAPVTGYVAKRTVQVGQRVQPGTPLMAVVPLHQVWIDANFKETQLDRHAHRPAGEIESDVYGGDVDLQRQGAEPGHRHRQRVLAAAGAECHRQLDQDRAAHPGARGVHRSGPAATSIRCASACR